jgi:hypothetical protein
MNDDTLIVMKVEWDIQCTPKRFPAVWSYYDVYNNVFKIFMVNDTTIIVKKSEAQKLWKCQSMRKATIKESKLYRKYIKLDKI